MGVFEEEKENVAKRADCAFFSRILCSISIFLPKVPTGHVTKVRSELWLLGSIGPAVMDIG